MQAALAIVSILAMASIGGVAVWMLTRLARTICELRGITAGLHDALRWSAGRVAAAEPSSQEPGPR